MYKGTKDNWSTIPVIFKELNIPYENFRLLQNPYLGPYYSAT